MKCGLNAYSGDARVHDQRATLESCLERMIALVLDPNDFVKPKQFCRRFGSFTLDSLGSLNGGDGSWLYWPSAISKGFCVLICDRLVRWYFS